MMFESLINFLVSPAYADTATPANAQAGGGFSFMVIIAVFFAFLFFFSWRPQSKRAKEQQNLINNLAKGDEILTTAGMLGKITALNDQYMQVNFGGNADVTMQKVAVVSVLPKGSVAQAIAQK